MMRIPRHWAHCLDSAGCIQNRYACPQIGYRHGEGVRHIGTGLFEPMYLREIIAAVNGQARDVEIVDYH